MRQSNGYALIAATDSKSFDGPPGKDFLFGDDENNKPYLCRMRLFIAQGRVFIAEAGGTKDNMLRDKPSVEWTLGSLRVQCNSLLSPVLASRTCNRW